MNSKSTDQPLKLSDVVRLELSEVDNGRWTFYRVHAVARNGLRSEQPAVNTVEQAKGRAVEWFPNATVAVVSVGETR